jgi:hypothetical protein
MTLIELLNCDLAKLGDLLNNKSTHTVSVPETSRKDAKPKAKAKAKKAKQPKVATPKAKQPKVVSDRLPESMYTLCFLKKAQEIDAKYKELFDLAKVATDKELKELRNKVYADHPNFKFNLEMAKAILPQLVEESKKESATK